MPRRTPDTAVPSSRRTVDFLPTACNDPGIRTTSGDRVRDQLGELLATLEREMRLQDRWERQRPADRALASREPFAVDTLDFDQWLQWIFIPKLHDMLVRQLPLPASCAVGPMAEEVYGPDDSGGRRITVIVSEIDILLTRQGQRLN